MNASWWQMMFTGQALVGMVVVSWLKTKKQPGKWDRFYLMELLVHLYLCSSFCVTALLSTIKMSDDYKAELVGKQRAQPQLSGLHESWLTPFLGGRLMDLKDAQYHEFRDSFQLLAMIVPVYLSLGFVVRYLARGATRIGRARARGYYIALFGLIASAVFHEAGTIKLLFFAGCNFLICRSLMGSSVFPVAMWVLNLAILFANEKYRGYSFVSIFGDLPAARMLDQHNGEMPWHHTFNFIMLRMMSYNLDYYWSKTKPKDKGGAEDSMIWKINDDKDLLSLSMDDEKDKKALSCSLEERPRTEQGHPQEIYDDFLIYVGYLLYLPLYIAGPTITYNNFVSHLGMPQQTYSMKGKLVYGLRFLGNLLIFEVLTHFIYVGAISYMAFRFKIPETDPSNGNRVYTPILVYLSRTEFGGPLDYEIVFYYSYWALMYLWFKFMLIWRFFRLWAVLDDIEPVENMNRCMNNNFTIGGFWRAWHRSFNRWLVRYIYIPLGGAKQGPLRKVFNIFIVFTFVGFWHDIKPELFAWGWLFSLFYAPEIIAGQIGRLKPVKTLLENNFILKNWVTAICGAGNILLLKFANIVGYTTGLEGAALLLPALQTVDGAAFVLHYYIYMMVGVQAMLFLRGEDMGDAKSKRV